MDEELILLEGDGCFTIINKSSVKYNPEIPELECGASISYFWPEEAAVKKLYTGIIVGISCELIIHLIIYKSISNFCFIIITIDIIVDFKLYNVRN